MVAGLKCGTTIRNLDFPMLFAQPGLVVPNHQDVTIMLQNCSDQDIEIPKKHNFGLPGKNEEQMLQQHFTY